MVPPRVSAFCWVACLRKILTVDKLKKSGHNLVNGCHMSLEAEEIASHLLIHCKFASKVWAVLLNRLGMTWVMLLFISDLFQ